MKAIAVCNKGCSEILTLEIKRLGGEVCDVEPHIVRFEIGDHESLGKIAYHTQIARHVMIELFVTEAKLEKIEEETKKIKWGEYLKKESTFAVYSTRMDETDLPGIAQEIGGQINDLSGTKVQLVKPTVPVRIVLVQDKCYCGIDLAYEDLTKRPYKIFATWDPLNASTAMAFLMWMEYKIGGEIFDFTTNSGQFGIEAGIHNAQISPHLYDKDKFSFTRWGFIENNWEKWFAKQDKGKKAKKIIHSMDSQHRFVEATKKNAVIAGVIDWIEPHRLDVEWLDVKFGKHSCSFIVSAPTYYVRDKFKFGKWCEELFYQVEFILSSKGKFGVLVQNKEEIMKAAAKYGFKLEKEHEFYQGKEKWIGLRFVRE